MGGRYQDQRQLTSLKGTSDVRIRLLLRDVNVVDILRVCVIAVNIFSVTKETMFCSVVFAVTQVI